MSKINAEIEKIIELAREIHALIEKGKLKKAKYEIKAIIDLDKDEIKRTEDQVQRECIEVLTAAKLALRELDSWEGTEQAKELIDKIIEIEREELQDQKKAETKDNELHNYWFKYFYNLVLYHGTSHIIAENLLKNGVIPGKKAEIWETAEKLRKKLKTTLSGIYLFGAEQEGLFGKASFSVTTLIWHAEAHKVPSTVTSLMIHTKVSMESIELIVKSNGDYTMYKSLVDAKAISVSAYLPERYFHRIDLTKLRSDLDEIQRLYNLLLEFKQSSKLVVLYIYARDVADQLPTDLRNAILDYKYFKNKFYTNYIGKGKLPTEDLAISKIISVFFKQSNEIRLRKRINAELFHLVN